MKNMNFPLLIGSIILIFLILVSFFPGAFTTHDPLFEESAKYIEYKKDGQWIEKFTMNPMPPNKDNIFGTDDAGRDVYARLVYGTRNTMRLALFIAILRMLLALPLGLAAGMNVKFISGIIKIFNTIFTAIPMLLFSFIVLNIGYLRSFEMDKSIIAFTLVLTIVGWAKLAAIIEDTTKRIMEEDFIEGEIAIGKTKLQIAFQNILPHIIPTSISLFFKEMGMALFLIAQLAVLHVFVGVTRQIKELAFRANYFMNLEPEWGGSLSRIAININKYNTVYWMTFYPILVFTVAIVGINLTGEGLRIEFQKRESKVISYIRKAYYLISPKMFIYQLLNFKKYRKPIRNKVLIIVIIVGYFIIPRNPSRYEYDLTNTTKHFNELTRAIYKGRVTGTDGGFSAGEYIIDTLKSYGYKVTIMEIPLTDIVEYPESGEQIIVPKETAPMVIKSGWIKIKDNKGKIKKFYLHQDFSISSINKKVFLEDKKEELNYKGIAATEEFADDIPEGIDFFAVTDKYYGVSNYGMEQKNEIKTKSNQTLKYDIRFSLNGRNHTNTYCFSATTIIPFYELSKMLEDGYREVEINFDYPIIPQYPARNIMAFLPGKDKTEEEPGELLIIGASYDGLHLYGTENPYAQTAAPAATSLELARSLSRIRRPLEKSIQFIFWDNEFERWKYSSLDGSNYFSFGKNATVDMALSHGYHYFDISYPGYKEEKFLNFISYPAQRADKNNYLMGLEMEKRLKNTKVKYRKYYYEYASTNALRNMRLNALSSIGVGNPLGTEINTVRDTRGNINYERMKDIGQFILDTLTMNSYIME